MTVSDHENNPFGIQWQRYWDGAPYPESVKRIPHVAFEVDDLDGALVGQKILIRPNSPSPGVTVAFIEVNGAPVELLQIDEPSHEEKQVMTEYTNLQMIEKAKTVLRPRMLSQDHSAGDVACALLSSAGNIYLGVCIDVGSGMGFCAEHSAIAAMITAGESSISKIVAVWGDGVVLPPCGRCREFMYEVDKTNYSTTDVILGENLVVKLKDLLPHPYDEVWNS